MFGHPVAAPPVSIAARAFGHPVPALPVLVTNIKSLLSEMTISLEESIETRGVLVAEQQGRWVVTPTEKFGEPIKCFASAWLRYEEEVEYDG
jgi:hypothetical protein